ncbi:putative sister chromatid cohesion protein PDS5 [Cardamine amara subsp. amara]|uniref:Sister chromatid cohesion protein PDS5 n=1 Tax=Cardamine amara subsp. amara TaxID=228776 RepID=A0ABD1B5G5_CARAN
MAQKPEELLKEFGSKLDLPPVSKDSLLKLLKEASVCLSELEQSPQPAVLESIQPFLDAVVKPEILNHQDKDVKLLVASCVSEITRITAPEAPYSDNIMKDIFQVIVSAFAGLNDVSGPSFGRRVVILETVAKYRSCVVMLDLECDDLVKEVFTTFLDVARDDHPEIVFSSMQNIMIVLLEESEDVQEHLLLILLSKLGRNRSVSILTVLAQATDNILMMLDDAARRLAMKVIEQCVPKVESDIKQFLISSMSGDSRFSSSQIDYHEVIYDLYRCAPQALSGVAPYLTGELLADKLETRLKVVGLVGELFSLPGHVISEEFSSIFLEFLKRLTDRVVDVRMTILDHIRNCLLSDPSRAEASQIISALCDRLLDYDENIRKQLVAERLRDKAILVKTYTMERLTVLFRVYCLRCADGKAGTGDFDWIPGKILRCLYDRDFRSDTIEYILCSSLFPSDFSVRDKVKHWIQIFSGFDKVETKAFEKILEQRQRIHQEMQRYLSIKQMQQSADTPEMQKKALFGFRVMSRAFSDPPKTEQNFLILDQLKDANIWKILTSLVDPNTSIMQASKIRDDMLKILSEKHSLYEFLSTLSIKCSYLLFSKEFVKEILAEVSARKSSKNILGVQSCMDFLGLLACFCPSLFDGAEEELMGFLKDDDEMIKEGTLKILAKAGGTIRENLIVLASSVDLLLERICVEGNRKQAKYAVLALASITKDDGLKSLSVLYKRLVDMLEDKRHQPAVLQCLGCIAQIAMPVFETRETEIVEFIRSKILKLKSEAVDDKKLSWEDKSEICQLKIYGIKTLVKSYLPFKDAHLRAGVDDLLGLLKNILSFGEVSEDLESSSVDKAHLRLAAAKAVLRLSRHWDDKIPIDIFHLTLKTPEIPFPTAKKIFLGKVHQYVKDRVLETKYACSFLFDTTGSNVLESEEEKQNLADIIQHSYQTKVRKSSAQTDANSVALYPHHILPYLVHALAHHSCPDVEKCKDVKEYEMIYRQLYLIVSMLLHKEDDGKAEDIDKEQECVPTIIFIFHSIKQSDDVTDATKSKNSHAICELGLSIMNHLTQKEPGLQGEITPVSLPPMLYKPSEKIEGDNSQVGEEQLWLADETVLAHFRALKLESHTDASVIPQTSENEVLIDGESDGNEIPLGKIVERLRAQGTKNRKGKKNKSVAAEDENGKNDVDVLKMVREINLDHLQMLDKFESSNGHRHSPGERADTFQRDQKDNKRNAGDETSVVSVPKRRRSSSGHSPFKFSNSGSKVSLKASEEELHQEKDMDKNVSSDSNDENSDREKRLESISPRKKKKSFSSKLKNTESDWGLTDLEHQSEGGNRSERSRSAESGDSKLKSASGSMKNRKRKSISGLAKCSTTGNKLADDELIGCRIDVWWPMDKRFYEGTVKSYDSSKQRHVILYEDGDVEVLNLDKERWELIDTGGKPAKKKSSASKGSSSKKRSSESKHKNSDSLQRDEDPITTTPKGKRTPIKYIKHKHPEGTSRSLSLEHDLLESRNKKNRSAVTPVGEIAERENENKNKKPMTKGLVYSGEADEEKSESEGKLLKEGEDDEEVVNKEDGLQEAKAELSGDAEEKETELDNSDSEGKQENNEMETEAEDNAGDAEISDNETLGAWKSKVGKSSSKKAV